MLLKKSLVITLVIICFQIIDTVIKELPKHRLTNGQNHAILMRLVVEFDVLPSHNLITLTDYCIAQLQKDVPDSNR
jgi:hypothetical protein